MDCRHDTSWATMINYFDGPKNGLMKKLTISENSMNFGILSQNGLTSSCCFVTNKWIRGTSKFSSPLTMQKTQVVDILNKFVEPRCCCCCWEECRRRCWLILIRRRLFLLFIASSKGFFLPGWKKKGMKIFERNKNI